jgi:hypothetical protein
MPRQSSPPGIGRCGYSRQIVHGQARLSDHEPMCLS